MAKAATPARKRKPTGELPAGFKPITGGFGLQWDFEDMPEMQGVVQRMDRVEVGKGKNKREKGVMDVKTKDGAVYAVWESAALSPLFAAVNVGDEVYIRYIGQKDVGQKQPMREFQAGFIQKKNGRAK